MMDIIKSVYNNQEDILKSIITIYCPDGFDADVTYSKGVFYKHGIPEPRYKFDLNPQTKNTVQADVTALPVENNKFNNVIFDPPFVAGSKKDGKPGIIKNRFGYFKTIQEHLWPFYNQSLKELYRIIDQKGYLIFKCQDSIDSGRQYMSHVKIMNYAVKAGFYPKDLFILVAKNRLMNQTRQLHARKFHCYFWVFQKINHKVKYSPNI